MRAILAIALLLAGCSGGFGTMDGIMKSWEGAPLDAVIAQWGYPAQEQTIGGHHIYRWFHTKQFNMPTSSTVTVTGPRTATVETTGGGTLIGECIRILEVDERNVVIRWQWEGNNCPMTEFPAYTDWRRK